MHRNLIIFIALLSLPVWPIQIIGSKVAENRWYVRFCHVPATENLGAFKVTLRLDGTADIDAVISDAPAGGAWSQVRPVLKRDGNLLEIFCVGPAMLASRSTDTVEMFNCTFELAGDSRSRPLFDGIIDSLWFDECLDTRGNRTVLPWNEKTVTAHQAKRAVARSESVDYRNIGRIHSLTFNLSRQEAVRAWVVDARGRLITKLAEKSLAPGMHTLHWPPDNRRIPSGTYFMQLEINNFTYHKKVSHYR